MTRNTTLLFLMSDRSVPRAQRRYRAVLWSVLLAAAGYLGFALWSGWSDVVNAGTRVGVVGAAIALLLSLVNYALRFLRWQAYLHAMHHPVPWLPSLKIYLAGFALTTTPGKAGEALRGVLLAHWGVPYPASLAAFLSERLSDLLAVIILTLLGLTLNPKAGPIVAIAIAAVLTAFVLFCSAGLLMRVHGAIHGNSRLSMFLRSLIEILLQARRCHTPLLVIGASGLSLGAWFAEAWAFHLILQWMGFEAPMTFAVFVYSISMLTGALSFLPGGLGGTEASMVASLIAGGVQPPEAIAATIVIRMVTLWFAVLLGLAFVVSARKHQNDASRVA